MAGSEAEERIRAKAEAALREAWPSGRIVHELMLRQGGCRIDLAAITTDRLICVEVKSERDVLTRLSEQIEQGRRVADLLVISVAAKHLDKVRDIARWTRVCDEDSILLHLQRNQRLVYQATCNAPARLEMLWASELRRIAQSGGKANRSYSILKASDELPGAEVRRRVCAALRARPFARADPPVVCDLFPEPSVGAF